AFSRVLATVFLQQHFSDPGHDPGQRWAIWDGPEAVWDGIWDGLNARNPIFAGLGTAGRHPQVVYGYACSCSRRWTPKCHLSGHQPTPHVQEVTPLPTA